MLRSPLLTIAVFPLLWASVEAQERRMPRHARGPNRPRGRRAPARVFGLACDTSIHKNEQTVLHNINTHHERNHE